MHSSIFHEDTEVGKVAYLNRVARADKSVGPRDKKEACDFLCFHVILLFWQFWGLRLREILHPLVRRLCENVSIFHHLLPGASKEQLAGIRQTADCSCVRSIFK